MPHIVIEHSKGLDEVFDPDEIVGRYSKPKFVLQTMCDELWNQFAAHPSVKGPETVRVRCHGVSASRIYGGANNDGNQSFLHVTLLLLPGRSDETRQELAKMIMTSLETHFPNVASLTVRIDNIEQPYLVRMKNK